MLKFICKRLLMMIPVLLGVTLLIFFLLDVAPGDPTANLLGENVTAEDIELLREELGLNKPFLVRFGEYVWGALHGDLGTSYQTGRPVLEMCLERFPVTIKLAIVGTAMIILVGAPLGIITALKRGTVLDTICTGFGMIAASMPRFWLGLLLILAFSLRLKWFPASGFNNGIEYMVLPAIAVGIGGCSSFMRTTRSSMLDVIRQDYIRTARAKGQAEGTVVMHHMLKNALMPMITVIGIEFGHLLSGAMITEMVFSIPGLNNFIIQNIRARDYPVVLGGVLLIALVYSLLNLVVDLIYAFVDPRVKASLY